MSLDRVSEAYRHCEELVRGHDKDHFLASLFAPANRRPYLFALYAFALEIARVKALVNEPMAGMIRLQWWHEALAGLRAGEAAASPVMIALQDAAEQTGISLAPLRAAIEAHQAELQGAPAVGAAAAIFMMAARIFGADGDAVTLAADRAAEAVTFAPSEPEKARDAYRAFRAQIETLPKSALPAFLIVSLVPLRLKRPDASQWRRQIALLRTAWFGFPKL
jgi:phytoene/squalene synthetase